MESLFSWGIEYFNLLLIVFISVLVLIVGLRIGIEIQTRRYRRKQLEIEARRHKAEEMRQLIKQMTPIEAVHKLRTYLIDTVNIYYSNKIHLSLHKAMLSLIVSHLNEKGYKIAMTCEDQITMQHWINPVLVIVPSSQTYLFHNDQTENRTKSMSLNIETSDTSYLLHEIDTAISHAGGQPSE